MKHLPLKLGIGVVLLFAVVIAVLLSWKPLQVRWHKSRLNSSDPERKMESIERLLKQGDKGRKIVEEYIYGKDSKWVRKNFGDPIAKFYSGYPAPALDAPEEKIEEWKEAQTAEVWNYKMLEIYFNIKRRVRGIIILDYFEWYRYREYPGFKRELMEALWKAENKNSNP